MNGSGTGFAPTAAVAPADLDLNGYQSIGHSVSNPPSNKNTSGVQGAKEVTSPVVTGSNATRVQGRRGEVASKTGPTSSNSILFETLHSPPSEASSALKSILKSQVPQNSSAILQERAPGVPNSSSPYVGDISGATNSSTASTYITPARNIVSTGAPNTDAEPTRVIKSNSSIASTKNNNNPGAINVEPPLINNAGVVVASRVMIPFVKSVGSTKPPPAPPRSSASVLSTAGGQGMSGSSGEVTKLTTESAGESRRQGSPQRSMLPEPPSIPVQIIRFFIVFFFIVTVSIILLY